MIFSRSSLLACAVILLATLMPGARAQTPIQPPESQEPGVPGFARHGPYRVGTREVVVPTDTDGRSLQATLWYPALNPTQAQEINTFTYDDSMVSGKILTIKGHALEGAAPDPSGGPYPLLVFSHGESSSRLLHIFIQEHVASYGFIVLGYEAKKPYYMKPKDMMNAIDFAVKMSLTSSSPFAGLIDEQKISVSGHAGGGWPAMQLAGIRQAELADSDRDPRVKAAIVMAPPSGPASKFDFSLVKEPVMLMVGSLDGHFKEPDLTSIFQALPTSSKCMVVILGGTHGGPFFDADLPGLNFGTVDFDRSHDLVKHFVTAFLLHVLKADPGARKALLPGAVPFKEIKYSTALE